jgi:hypothetical protein
MIKWGTAPAKYNMVEYFVLLAKSIGYMRLQLCRQGFTTLEMAFSEVAWSISLASVASAAIEQEHCLFLFT